MSNEKKTDLQKKLDDMKKQRDVSFSLSDQALMTIALCLQKAIAEQSDITETLRELEFQVQPTIRSLFVKNPPVYRVSPELEERVKERFLERLEEAKKTQTQ